MRMGNKPVGALARPAAVAPAKKARRPGKPARRHRGPVFAFIIALFAIGGAAAFAARTWPHAWPKAFALNSMFSFSAAKKPEVVAQKQTGHIIIPRSHSELCDRFSFDNKNGAMKTLNASPCHQREEVKIVDQVNSFSSSWRGAR